MSALALGALGSAKARLWPFLGSPCPPLGLRSALMQGLIVNLIKVSLLVPAWPSSLLISRSVHFLSSQTLVLPFLFQGLARPPGQLSSLIHSLIHLFIKY